MILYSLIVSLSVFLLTVRKSLPQMLYVKKVPGPYNCNGQINKIPHLLKEEHFYFSLNR
jgi:hypothetical protein